MRNHPALLDHPVGFPGRDGRLFDPVSALIAGGATLLGSAISGSASKSAANTEADAANRATDLQQQNLAQTRQSLQPFVNGGYDAQNSLRSMLGIGANDGSASFGSLTKPFDAAEFSKWQDPGYKFQLQQGQQALQNSQAAQNGVLSGSALKDLIGFNQGMASTGYQNAFGRYMTQNDATYKRLADLLGIGENAAAGAGNMGIQASSNIANTMTSGANALAAGQVGSANALSGGLSNMGSMYALSKMMNPTAPLGEASLARDAFSAGGGTPSFVNSGSLFSGGGIADYAPATTLPVGSLPFLDSF